MDDPAADPTDETPTWDDDHEIDGPGSPDDRYGPYPATEVAA